MESHASARSAERTAIPGQGGSALHAAVARLCQGIDEEASFRFVHDALYGQVRSFFVARGVVEDVPDLTQEVFVRLYKSRGRIRHPERIRGLVWVVCQNVFHRWLSEKPPAYAQELPDVADDTTPEDIYTCKELGSRLRAALLSLPPRTGLVARMRFVDGLSNTEIAKALGMTRNNVGVLVHDSKVRLRKTLES